MSTCFETGAEYGSDSYRGLSLIRKRTGLVFMAQRNGGRVLYMTSSKGAVLAMVPLADKIDREVIPACFCSKSLTQVDFGSYERHLYNVLV
jgi:hypothetical protein